MRNAERKKMNAHAMMYLRSLVGVSRIDRFKNEEACRRAGIVREVASRVY